MANKLFYRGKRKSWAGIYTAYGLAISASGLCNFTASKYIVYSQDGVSIKHPLVHEEGYKVEKTARYSLSLPMQFADFESNYDSVKSVAGGKLLNSSSLCSHAVHKSREYRKIH